MFFCIFASCLSGYVETGTVLPLWLLNTDLLIWHLGAPDAMVDCYEQFYCKPTLYVAACSRVGMFPLCHEAADNAFECSLRLHGEEAVHIYYKEGEVVVFTEESLKLFILLLLIHRLKEIIRQLVPVV